MAATKYTFSVSGDTANGVVAPSSLSDEIAASAIVIALDYITVDGDALDIWMKDSLSAGDETILGTVVGAHEGVEPVESLEVDLLGVPKSDEGKIYMISQSHPKATSLMFAGAADDITNGVKYGGDLFMLQETLIQSTTLLWQFIDSVNLSGGIMSWSGAIAGDYFDYELTADASVGANQSGDYTKVEIIPSSGLNMYVYVGPGAGDWDLDLSETWNANVSFPKLTPVPSGSPRFFDYDPKTETLSLNATGEGGYNLFDFPINLGKFVNKFPIIGTHTERVEKTNEKSKLILPQWKHTARLTNSSLKTLSLVWTLFISRYDISF